MKNDLPYFSHDNNARNHPKMKALIAEFGYEGYGRFWVLNERIAETTGACIDISRKVNKLDLAKELGFDGAGLDGFLKFLSDPEIDLINFDNGKITTDRINELYSKTINKRKKQRKSDNAEIVNDFAKINSDNAEIVNDLHTEEKRREERRIDKNINSSGCAGYDKPIFEKQIKTKKPPLREREPENDHERVEKAYFQNWDKLYAKKFVETEQPIITNTGWIQIRSMLKGLFSKNITPDLIINALNKAMNDEWVLSRKGYSLSAMLTSDILNGLINGKQRAPPQTITEKKSLSGLKPII